MNASRRKVVEQINKSGFVQAHRSSSLHGKRRAMLRDMADKGQVVLSVPVIGSYLTYSAPEEQGKA